MTSIKVLFSIMLILGTSCAEPMVSAEGGQSAQRVRPARIAGFEPPPYLLEGRPAELRVSNLLSGAEVRFLGSRNLSGPREVLPGMGFALEIAGPSFELGRATADATGVATLVYTLPAGIRDRQVELQALVSVAPPAAPVRYAQTAAARVHLLSSGGDWDRDGISNGDEVFVATDPLAGDSDRDGVSDLQDEDALDRTACHDLDQDGCDDCSGGSMELRADGADADGDGLCDLGLAPLVGWWTFEPGEELLERTTQWGTLSTTPGASVTEGRLFVDADGLGNGLATAGAYTGPDLFEKTLISWVALEDLDRQAGSALTLDAIAHDRFDAIVYGERIAHRWMAGSTHFQHTRDVVPFDEVQVGVTHQIAIAYRDAGGGNVHITVCRDGVEMGSYEAGSMFTHGAGDSEVFFGVRHSVRAGHWPGHLMAHIEEARIYGAALDCAVVGTLVPAH